MKFFETFLSKYQHIKARGIQNIISKIKIFNKCWKNNIRPACQVNKLYTKNVPLLLFVSLVRFCITTDVNSSWDGFYNSALEWLIWMPIGVSTNYENYLFRNVHHVNSLQLLESNFASNKIIDKPHVSTTAFETVKDRTKNMKYLLTLIESISKLLYNSLKKEMMFRSSLANWPPNSRH